MPQLLACPNEQIPRKCMSGLRELVSAVWSCEFHVTDSQICAAHVNYNVLTCFLACRKVHSPSDVHWLQACQIVYPSSWKYREAYYFATVLCESTSELLDKMVGDTLESRAVDCEHLLHVVNFLADVGWNDCLLLAVLCLLISQDLSAYDFLGSAHFA